MVRGIIGSSWLSIVFATEALMLTSQGLELDVFLTLLDQHQLLDDCRCYVTNAIRRRRADVMREQVRRLATSLLAS